MKNLSRLMAALLIIIMLTGIMPIIALAEADDAIVFADANLAAAIKQQMGKDESEDITEDEAAAWSDALWLDSREISNLEGLQYFTSISNLDLQSNQISDISPLAGLTELTSLELWNNQITDISPLAELTALEGLGLGKNNITDTSPLVELTNLTSLNLWNNQISDISPLSGLTALRVLGLDENNITDTSPLSGLTALEWLNLDRNNITDTSPLSGLIALEELGLGENNITDTLPLAELANLTSLNLKSNQITDISPLAELTNLTDLTLWNNQITDISPLANLVNLTYLDLDTNLIRDISALSGLVNLQTIYLINNPINTSDGSAAMQVIETLQTYANDADDIHYDKITKPCVWINRNILLLEPAGTQTLYAYAIMLGSENVTWSSSNPAVATVNSAGEVTAKTAGTAIITATSVAAPSIKSNCTVMVVEEGYFDTVIEFPDENLENAIRERIWKPEDDITVRDIIDIEYLDLGYRNISDLTGLQYFTSLIDLYLYGNDISDISPLEGLAGLKWVNLGYNNITDISSLVGLAGLEWLSLSENNITDISSLVGLAGLEWLDLGYNNITDISPLAGLTELIDLNLYYNNITDISALENLINLRFLVVDWNYLNVSVNSDARKVINKLLELGCDVYYENQNFIGVWFDNPAILLQKGDSQPLNVSFDGFNPKDIKNVEWSCSNEDIVTVSTWIGAYANAESAGQATITFTVTLKNGNVYTADCYITVVNNMNDKVPLNPKLEAAIKDCLGWEDGITYNQATWINWLELSDCDIDDLTGLEYFVNLNELYLSSNKITDISQLSGLGNLRYLNLCYNEITDISPLMGMQWYSYINLEYNGLDLTDSGTMAVINHLKDIADPWSELYYEKQERKINIEFYDVYWDDEIENFGDNDGIVVWITNAIPELANEEVTVVISMYDESGKMIGDLQMFNNQTLGLDYVWGGWHWYIDLSNAGNVDKVKVMVWDNADTMIPLANSDDGVIYKGSVSPAPAMLHAGNNVQSTAGASRIQSVADKKHLTGKDYVKNKDKARGVQEAKDKSSTAPRKRTGKKLEISEIAE